MSTTGQVRGIALCAHIIAFTSSCASTEVTSEHSAELAYLGVDRVVSEGLALGLQGFNAASSANIPPQESDGESSGKIDVTGQVDQGASDNKGMRLSVTLTDYADEPLDDPNTEAEEALDITYRTEEPAPLALELQLRDIPDGTLTGALRGEVWMEGDLEGAVLLDITLSGEIESDGDGGTRRVPGSTRVSGTAQSDYGVYEVVTEL